MRNNSEIQPERDSLECWTEEELLLQYRVGHDERLFAALVQRYEASLLSFLEHYLGNAEAAKDVLQNTFLQIHLKCGQFREGQKVRPWLYKIAVNQAIDHFRRQSCRSALSLDNDNSKSLNGDRAYSSNDADECTFGQMRPGGDPLPEEILMQRERAMMVRRAISAVESEVYRSVLVCICMEGMKYREAADVLDIPIGTVKSRMHKAIQMLTEKLKALGVDEADAA